MGVAAWTDAPERFDLDVLLEQLVEHIETLVHALSLEVVAVHHNWIRGDRNKWERSTAYQTIVTDDHETYRHFLKRARGAMATMTNWVYRNPNHPGNGPARLRARV